MNAIIDAVIATVDAEVAKLDAKPKRTPEQKAKDAANARARRAAAKAAKAAAPVSPLGATTVWQNIEVEGKTVKVAGNLSPAEALAAAHKLVGAKAAAKAAAKAEKPPKPAAKKKAPRADKTHQRVYLSAAQFKRIEDDAAWRTAHDTAWKSLKAGTRVEQKAKDGSVRKVYHSVLLQLADVSAVQKRIAAK